MALARLASDGTAIIATIELFVRLMPSWKNWRSSSRSGADVDAMKRSSIIIIVAIGAAPCGSVAALASPHVAEVDPAGMIAEGTSVLSRHRVRSSRSFAGPTFGRHRDAGGPVHTKEDLGPPNGDVGAAIDVVHHYYQAIDERDYVAAYDMLRPDGGEAESFSAFRSAYADTRSIHAVTGTPGGIAGAAGSDYVTVPLVVDTVLDGGAHRRLTGTCVLRRLSAEETGSGADARWHIFSMDLHERQHR